MLATAQEPPVGASAPADGAETAASDATPATQPASSITSSEDSSGDVIILNDGTEYRGFQIIKETPGEFILEIVEGVTISIPRRLVRLPVQYDHIDPNLLKRERAAAKAKAAQSTLISAQRLSPELQALLNTDISDPPINLTQTDFLEAVSAINPRVKNCLVVDPPILDLPPENRVCSLSTQAGMTLNKFLEEQLAKAFSDLAILVKDNTIHLTTKAVAAAAQGPPPSSSPGTEQGTAVTAAPSGGNPPASP
ncbi:MAG: hypothetical protein AMXMBFR4_23060 [Candidatus Hydrogenedentota bacterium]